MRVRICLPLLAGLAGCGTFDTGPKFSIPAVCEDQVYADPTVKDLILKGAGSPSFQRNHENELAYAKSDAAHRCMQQKGLLPPGGGVQRQRVTD
jgi:hypothetical protein